MAHDAHLADLLAQAVTGRAGLSFKRMFGGGCWLLNGHMLCFAQDSRFMFRVGKDQEPELLQLPGVEPMVHNGRRMGGLIWVEADAAIDGGLDVWVARAVRFASSLPPKQDQPTSRAKGRKPGGRRPT
jgi:TfoX/Sxy family transcriptional regulator of competence genes